MFSRINLSLLLGIYAAPAVAQGPNEFFTVYNLIRQNFNTGRNLVRMAFHDAMGGVDATVNPNDEEHNGLENTIAELNALWTNNQADLPGLTRSDFFAWSYVAGFYLAVPNNPPWVPLTFGRADWDGIHDEDIPPNSDLGSGGHSDVLSYFSNNFGFDAREVAVILGAHTLVGLLIFSCFL